jgi:small subunit ribosomal protein S3
MGQKVNPNSLRIGYIKGWESNWFSSKKEYAEKLLEDYNIRRYLEKRMAKASLSKILIERSIKQVVITIHSAKPGIIIGKGGGEVERIKEELHNLTGKEIHINIFEIKRPELDAKLVSMAIAQQIQARISYKRAVKQAIASTMRGGAQGIKVSTGGRLGGDDIARAEQSKEGRIPLHTLRADIDYAFSEALTVYGKIGVKVWIFKGEVYERSTVAPESSKPAGSSTTAYHNKRNTFRKSTKTN